VFSYDEVIKFLGMDSKKIAFKLDEKQRRIPLDVETRKPLQMNELLIDEIARRTGLLSGKWLIFVDKEHADELWDKIERLANEGKIWSAKISTRFHPWASRGKHVVCVYTQNYLDQHDVSKTREVLKEIGIKGKLSYKADIYTVLGIYSDNKADFGLDRVTRYSS